MAPRTRYAKTSSKENVSSSNKTANKVKAVKRKPLRDKTNSGSDDNSACKVKTNRLNSSSMISKARKESDRIKEKFGVYEFTYDPDDEPPPQKKKRKRVTKKKPTPKPKSYFFTQNYDKNLSKALEKLKTKIKETTSSVVKVPSNNIETNSTQFKTQVMKTKRNMANISEENVSPKLTAESAHIKNKEPECEINYSPVQSANPILDTPQTLIISNENDILTVQDDITFFDDIPVASSSFNTSKHSIASPWRVDIDLPYKTPVNMCLKANMTPAFEGSFIDDQTLSNKKHVYTNILSEPCEAISQQIEKTPVNDNLNWKQSSILSFIKEVAVKNMKKKKFITPIKNNSIFDDSIIDVDVITKQMSKSSNEEKTSGRSKTPEPLENKNCTESVLGKNKTLTSLQIESEFVDKSPTQKNHKYLELPSQKTLQQNDVGNCFGFDDTHENNQENMPVNRIADRRRMKALKPRSRAVLRELNRIGPSRANLPRVVKVKGRDTEKIKKIYEQMQSEQTAVSEVVENDKSDRTNSDASAVIQNIRNYVNDEDSQSIHLFEDIDIVHHLKASRKSYGKAKKVAFHRSSNSDAVNQGLDESFHSDDEYTEDKTFRIPAVKEDIKKTVPKKKVQKLSKKEEEEFEAWAADFNSMCEAVEHVPLVVE